MNASHRIRSVHMEIGRLSPAEADVRFEVTVDRPDKRLDTKGRLVGPRCVYASTVEVAYPLRDSPAGESNRLSKGVIIPEPNLWEPACPFLYEGTIELLENQSPIDVITMTVGLRTIAISGRSFLLNGRRFEPKAIEIAQVTEADLAEARNESYTVVLPVAEDARPFWQACDRIGVGVFGRLPRHSMPAREHFANHPCLLGWIADEAPKLANEGAEVLPHYVPIGLEVGNDRASANRPDVDFVIVPRYTSAQFEELGRPVVELTPRKESL